MQLNRFLAAPLALAAAVACAPAMAGVEIIVGDTTNSATFNRAFEDFSGLSGVGTAVRFDAFSFSVSVSGEYSFLSSTPRPFTGNSWDNFLFLYQGSFNPADATANGLIANDDFEGSTRRSGFSVNLMAGEVYTLVTTGFENDDFGRYINRFEGVGDITSPVPEPGAAAMLLAGLAALGFVARRRKA